MILKLYSGIKPTVFNMQYGLFEKFEIGRI
jgi:hypothetical protein